MSEKLLDLAVEEACDMFHLPADHFLRNSSNITAAKNMIAGDAQNVQPEKAWLYTIVCNKKSGECLSAGNATLASWFWSKGCSTRGAAVNSSC